MNRPMSDPEKLKAMRELGVKWPSKKPCPVYPPSMNEAQRKQADRLYDAMSAEFIERHTGYARC